MADSDNDYLDDFEEAKANTDHFSSGYADKSPGLPEGCHMAAQLGYDNIFGYQVAEDLGLLSGLSATVAEMPELVILIGNDQSGFLAGIKELAGSITSDPALLADLISSLPESVKEKQELENPYAVGTTLHDRFANGWYSGYIGTQILSFYVGGREVLQAVKSLEMYIDDIEIIGGAYNYGKLFFNMIYGESIKEQTALNLE